MIIICPNCESKFKVSKDAIGPSGRFVRCSSCSHEWLAQAKSALKTSAKEPIGKLKPQAHKKIELSDDKQVKAEIKNKRFYDYPAVRYIAYFIAAISITLLVLFNLAIHREYLVSYAPWLQDVYNECSLFDNHALKLEIVRCKEEGVINNDSSVVLEVESIIKNISNVPQKLSTVRFTLFDDHRKTLGSLELNVDKTIAANDSFKLDGKLDQVPQNSRYIAVDFGNTLDLFFRDIEYINIHRH